MTPKLSGFKQLTPLTMCRLAELSLALLLLYVGPVAVLRPPAPGPGDPSGAGLCETALRANK